MSVIVKGSKSGIMRFLVDTGTEISIVKGACLMPGVAFQPTEGIKIKGIADSVLWTEGTVTLTLLTQAHETSDTFHIMSDDFDCMYDGILGRDFWEDKKATIDYCNRTIKMGEVMLQLDNASQKIKEQRKLKLEARTENIVLLPTHSRGQGFISKQELIPGVYLAESLTVVRHGHCITSIVNTLCEEVTLDTPLVNLEECEFNDQFQYFRRTQLQKMSADCLNYTMS